MTILNRISSQNIIIDNVLQYKTELQNQIKYISTPDKAIHRQAHLLTRKNRLEKQLNKVQSIIPKNSYVLHKGIQKSNAKIKKLEKLETKLSKATSIFRKIFLNIKKNITEALLGCSTKDLPHLKQVNRSLKNALSQIEELEDRRGHLNHLLRTTRLEKTQIDQMNIPVEKALILAEHQIKIDMERYYTYTINDQTYSEPDAVISKLKEISEDGMGRLVLFKLSSQTLASLLKNTVRSQLDAFYHQTPDNAQYFVQEISQANNIHIKQEGENIHIHLTAKHSVQDAKQKEYYQMDSSIDLELDKSGNIVRATLNVVPTS